MQYHLTKEFLLQIEEEVTKSNLDFVKEHINPLHPADIAEIFNEIDIEAARYIFDQLEEEKSAQVLVELTEEQREKLLVDYSSQEIAEEIIDNLESDDAAYIISELSEDQQEEVLSYVEDIQQASDIVDILNYEEGTAGALMGKELIKVYENWTVEECIAEIRKQAQEVDKVFTIYVVGLHDKLIGILSLKTLILESPQRQIHEICDREVISLKAKAESEEAVKVMEKYDLEVLPIVDDIGRLLGIINIDDVLDIIKEEAEKDFQIASGYSEVVESTDSVWILSRSRLPWLLVGLMGGIMSSRVIGMYEKEIQIYPEMAFFIPLIAAMGGNAGVQSSAIVVQAIANETIQESNIREKLWKEFRVSIINGLVCSIIILLYSFTIGNSMYLGFTVSIALLSVIIFATLLGAFTPRILHKYKIDPAIATGPFITTSNDILGLFIYFLIGRLMYIH